MKKIIEYAAVERRDAQELSDAINHFIKDGWEVYGNLIGNTLSTSGGSHQNYDTIYIFKQW